MIDAAYVINLDRRPERLTQFREHVAEVIDWPMPVVHHIPAVDGWTYPGVLPRAWGSRGSFGCWASHLFALKLALEHGHRSVAIFEDDAVFGAHFGKHVRDLLAAVPNWEALYLGGEHLRRPVPIHGALRCRLTVRTHAYVVRDRALDALVDELEAFRGHFPHDWTQGLLLSFYRTYAPERFFVAQAAGHSDCTNKDEPYRNWDLT